MELQAYYREHGRDPDECVVAHENFLHLVLTDDPEREERRCHEVRPWTSAAQYLESVVYLFSERPGDMASSAAIDAWWIFVLHTMTPDPPSCRRG